jgi:hypothetical protein
MNALILNIANRIMETMLLHNRGRANAEPRRVIEDRLKVWCIDVNDRTIREAYSTLPICACNEGLYLPITTDDVESFRAYAMKTRPPAEVQMKVRRIYQLYEHLSPKSRSVQMDLDMSAAMEAEVRA